MSFHRLNTSYTIILLIYSHSENKSTAYSEMCSDKMR